MSKDDLGRYHSPALLIMVSLAEGEKHGYAIMEDVEVMAGIQLGPGTLYGAISRLEARALIEPVEDGSRRQPYRLTEAGSQFLQTELERMRSWSGEGLRRLGLDTV